MVSMVKMESDETEALRNMLCQNWVVLPSVELGSISSALYHLLS